MAVPERAQRWQLHWKGHLAAAGSQWEAWEHRYCASCVLLVSRSTGPTSVLL